MERVRELFRHKHFLVTLDDEAGILRRARTGEAFASIRELEDVYAELLAVLAPLDRSKLGQLIDARQAPPRNDPEFEAAVTRHHAELYRDFRATAVVVRMAAGKLQVKRMLEASGIVALVCVNEADAVAYLRGELGGMPSARER
jgi:hypothetical protein